MKHGTFRSTRRLGVILILGALVLLTFARQRQSPVRAQGGPTPLPKTVTADQVNRVASRLFCPVCENIPLDTCGTAACAQWRDEIRLQLESGKTEQQVIDDFVARYGDRVVGTPQDPTLRALTLVTPWAISLIALGAAAFIFLRWRAELVAQSRKAAGSSTVPSAAQAGPMPASENEYRARLERDLARRR